MAMAMAVRSENKSQAPTIIFPLTANPRCDGQTRMRIRINSVSAGWYQYLLRLLASLFFLLWCLFLGFVYTLHLECCMIMRVGWVDWWVVGQWHTIESFRVYRIVGNIDGAFASVQLKLFIEGTMFLQAILTHLSSWKRTGKRSMLVIEHMFIEYS
jgi:hypothetical protein